MRREFDFLPALGSLLVMVVWSLGISARAEERVAIGIDSTLEATLDGDDPLLADRGRYKTFVVQAGEAGKITIAMESPFFDAHLLVRDREGEKIAEDADGGPGDGARVVLDVAPGQSYTILALAASEHGVGAFGLSVRRGAPERLSGREEIERDRDWYATATTLDLTSARRIRVLHRLAVCHDLLGTLQEALEPLELALRIARDTDELESEGRLLIRLGSILSDIGRAQDALEHLERALRIAQDRGDRGMELSIRQALGIANAMLRRFESAIGFYEDALKIGREIGERRDVADTLSNLGIAYRRLGYPERAIRYYEEAIEIDDESGDRWGKASTLMNLGNMYKDLGRFDKAVEYQTEAREVFHGLGDRRSEAKAVSNLGTSYKHLREFEKATELYGQALGMFDELGIEYLKCNTLVDLGTVYRQQGEVAKAIDHYERALEIEERSGSGTSATIFHNLAVAHSALGEHEKAIEHARRALSMARERKNPVHVAGALWLLGSLHMELGGDWQSALEHFRSAYSIERELLERVELGLEESAASSLAAKLARGVVAYLDLLVRRYREEESESTRDALLREALDLVEGLRVRSLVRSMRASDVRDLLSDDGKQAWGRRDALENTLSTLISTARRSLPRDEGARADAIAELEAQCRPYEEEIASLERKLKENEPKLGSIFPGRFELDATSLARVVEADEVLLHFNFVEEGKGLAVFSASRRAGLALDVLQVDAETLESELAAALAEIRAPSVPGKATDAASLRKQLGSLGQKLLAGLGSRLEGAKGLLVIPDGPLHLFPFEALVLDGEYLIERYAVRYGPSIRTLLDLKASTPGDAEVEAVLYGDPDFEATALAMNVRGGDRLAKLAHASTELDAIGKILGKTLVRRGEEATETRFKEESSRSRMVHVATHGTFADAPGSGGHALFYSGIAFSGYHRGDDGSDDGFLTAAEAMALDLREVELVVLSACQTATGTVRGYEGKFGLERGFFVAGVRTFVGSLWQVEDEATAEFMARYYRSLREGMSKSQALRSAKLDFLSELRAREGASDGVLRGAILLKSAGDPGRALSHPFFWAPFVLSGDGSGRLFEPR